MSVTLTQGAEAARSARCDGGETAGMTKKNAPGRRSKPERRTRSRKQLKRPLAQRIRSGKRGDKLGALLEAEVTAGRISKSRARAMRRVAELIREVVALEERAGGRSSVFSLERLPTIRPRRPGGANPTTPQKDDVERPLAGQEDMIGSSPLPADLAGGDSCSTALPERAGGCENIPARPTDARDLLCDVGSDNSACPDCRPRRTRIRRGPKFGRHAAMCRRES